MLGTYPFLRIWHAGCSTGEEVYSMAILLQEEGLYDRCRIYATDMNGSVLRQADEGIFPAATVQQGAANYARAGGTQSLSEYYTSAYGRRSFARLYGRTWSFRRTIWRWKARSTSFI